MGKWNYVDEGKYPESYKRVLITVLDDEGKRVVVSGMFVTKVINRRKMTKKIWYWLYDSDDVFVTSGEPGACSKPIAWMYFPEPCGSDTKEDDQDELQACKYAMAMSEKVEKQLREQIEKMKCCENCKHYSASCGCNLPFEDCFEMCAWELRK